MPRYAKAIDDDDDMLENDNNDILENYRILLKEISEEEYQELINYMDSQNLDYEEL